MALGKKEADTTARLTHEEREARYTEIRAAASAAALQSEKVRYKSKCNPDRFKEFLEHRLTIWDDLKDKTFHGKRMYNKTKEVLEGLAH
jgi:hypothetical protein|tara:strand:+ start:927 stop:1193 length:267 start_codon:yes stop_codon:yes gene_type:complete